MGAKKSDGCFNAKRGFIGALACLITGALVHEFEFVGLAVVVFLVFSICKWARIGDGLVGAVVLSACLAASLASEGSPGKEIKEGVIGGALGGFIMFSLFPAFSLLARCFYDGVRCAHCKAANLTELSRKTVATHWKYANKDGSPDKRRKDNYEISVQDVVYVCNKCNKETVAIFHSDSKAAIEVRP